MTKYVDFDVSLIERNSVQLCRMLNGRINFRGNPIKISIKRIKWMWTLVHRLYYFGIQWPVQFWKSISLVRIINCCCIRDWIRNFFFLNGNFVLCQSNSVSSSEHFQVQLFSMKIFFSKLFEIEILLNGITLKVFKQKLNSIRNGVKHLKLTLPKKLNCLSKINMLIPNF